MSCYEAGRDGFWLQRYLHRCGIDNVVVDSASLEADRRLRKAKTDRSDAGKLLRMLVRYHGGEKFLWRVIRLPSREDEGAMHLHRELEALKSERSRHRDREWVPQQSVPLSTTKCMRQAGRIASFSPGSSGESATPLG